MTNPAGYKYIGGGLSKCALAYDTEMALDGAASDGIDNAFRTAIDGRSLEKIGYSAIEGFAGSAVMSPVIGGGMKCSGGIAQKLFAKDNLNIGVNTH